MQTWQTLLIGLSGLVWPLVFVVDRMVRLPDFPVDYLGSLVFAPMGLIAGWFTARWIARASTTIHKVVVGLGYLAASPLAYWGGLGGGLLHPILGPAIMGAIPLILGSGLGYLVGRLFSRAR